MRQMAKGRNGMRGHSLCLAISASMWLACGSTTPPIEAPESAPPPASAANAEPVAPPAASTIDASGEFHDPHEATGPIVMAPLFERKIAKSEFPKQTVGDKECWQGMELEGEFQKDYDNLIAR